MCTRFRKVTGHHSGDGAHEVTDHEKYTRENLQFLEKHIAACLVGRPTL